MLSNQINRNHKRGDLVASIIVPIYNNAEYTARALASMFKHTKLNFEVILIDNNSSDINTEIFSRVQGVQYFRMDENLGFVKAVNFGIKQATGKYIVIANNDIRVTNRWLEKLVEAAKAKKVGIVSMLTTDGGPTQNIGAQFNYPLSKIGQEDSDEMNEILEENNLNPIEEKNSIIFCLALIKREVIKKIGLLSVDFGVGLGDDGDYCIRARKAGFKLIIVRNGFFYHHAKTTFHNLYTDEQIRTMQDKNIAKLKEKHPIYYRQVEERLNAPKPKTVLITNNHLKVPGGSETYTYTLAKELAERGYKVDVFTFVEGQVTDNIKKFANVTQELKKEYDLMFINHNSCLRVVKGIKGFKFYTSHGVYPALEQPRVGADYYVAVSEEVQQHLKNLNFDSQVIRNGIDTKRFSPKRPISKQLKNVLCLCQGEVARNNVLAACNALGINCIVHLYIRREWDIVKYMDEADLVVSLGRGAYEAMSMGREVLVYDSRGYTPLKTGDGLVRPEMILEAQKCNLSGRSFRRIMDVQTIIAELKRYDHTQGQWNRQYATENFNIEKQVNKYLKIYEDRRHN